MVNARHANFDQLILLAKICQYEWLLTTAAATETRRSSPRNGSDLSPGWVQIPSQSITLFLWPQTQMVPNNQRATICPKLKLSSFQNQKQQFAEHPFLLVSQYALTDRSDTSANFPDISRMRRSEPTLNRTELSKSRSEPNAAQRINKSNVTRYSLEHSEERMQGGDTTCRHEWKMKAPKPIDTSDNTTKDKGKTVESDGSNIRPSEDQTSKCGGLMDIFQQIKCTDLLMQRLASIRRHSCESGISPHSSKSRKSPLRQSFPDTTSKQQPTNTSSMTPKFSDDASLFPKLGSAKNRPTNLAPKVAAPSAPAGISRLRYLPGCGRVLVVQKPRASPLRQHFGGGALASSPGISPFKSSGSPARFLVPRPPSRSPRRFHVLPDGASGSADDGSRPAVIKVLGPTAGAAGLGPRRMRKNR